MIPTSGRYLSGNEAVHREVQKYVSLSAALSVSISASFSGQGCFGALQGVLAYYLGPRFVFSYSDTYGSAQR